MLPQTPIPGSPIDPRTQSSSPPDTTTRQLPGPHAIETPMEGRAFWDVIKETSQGS